MGSMTGPRRESEGKASLFSHIYSHPLLVAHRVGGGADMTRCTGTGAGGGASFLSFLPFLPFRQGALACAAASGASDPMANSCAAPYMAAAR